MSFLKSRLKSIENQVGLNDVQTFVIVFLSSEDGECVEVSGMYKDGTYKNETLKTDADLYRFFDKKSSVSVCMIKPFDGEVIKGSLYDKVTASDVDKIGKARIDRTFIDDVPEGDDEI